MKRVILICSLFSLPLLLLAQAPTKPSFLYGAVIQHNENAGALTANFPRPLMQALEAISQEYGWTVDY